ncbi:phage tail tape measure protein [Pseudooceanicola aestuarii]|uniref:phage tail tape measure protein n=1 Tax=Pseudooceanicola aestuarii TaxID=2697319 RepID=UPI0013D49470|nr:phage tail tape measure protein [Pseudooceanicola aestuarii]
MDENDALEEMQDQVAGLSQGLGQAAGMAAGFEGEMRRLRGTFAETGRDMQTLERGLSRGLRRALDGVLFDGMKASDALRSVAQSVAATAWSAAAKPVTSHFGGMIAQGVGSLMQGVLPFARGGAFSQGRVRPFAGGGVVNGPVQFPMRGGVGVMGEAGPEAILPLTRGADGRLGVQAGGGGRTVNVVMNIRTPDAESFRRSQSQVAAQMSRALSMGRRNR